MICNGTDDGQPCPEQGNSDSLGLNNAVAATVRRHLKRRGWAVNLTNPEPGGYPRRLDYCGRHKQRPGRANHGRL